MKRFGRRDFIKVTGQSAVAALMLGASQSQAFAQHDKLIKFQKQAGDASHNRQIVDVHCHLFNAQYAITEFVAAGWNLIFGHYPHRRHAAKDAKILEKIASVEGAIDFAVWIARLLAVATSDCADIYDHEVRKFNNSTMYSGSSLISVPLMMDIYYILDDNMDEQQANLKEMAPMDIEAFGIPDGQRDRFEEHFKECKTIILNEYKKLPEGNQLILKYSKDFDKVFENVKQDMLDAGQKPVKGTAYEGIELSPGFKKHLHALEAVRQKHPGTVFPFLAVDPRRIGIKQLIDMKIDKGNGIFKGIKLYPPLGYLPTHPNLREIYDYCQMYDIPITVHCSQGGIQNKKKQNFVRCFKKGDHIINFEKFDGSKAKFYAAPEKWEPVLKDWPKLRLNLAHFGGGDKLDSNNLEWINHIKSLMEYENVYSDISYYTRPQLAKQISKLVAKHEIFQRKLMFGTDFIMILLDHNLDGVGEYFNRFCELNNNLLCDNAKRFLNI